MGGSPNAETLMLTVASSVFSIMKVTSSKVDSWPMTEHVILPLYVPATFVAAGITGSSLSSEHEVVVVAQQIHIIIAAKRLVNVFITGWLFSC